MIGGLYLIQPFEYLNTNVYKIGCSHKQSPYDRIVSGYKKGTDIYVFTKCENPFQLEDKLKKKFNKYFKLFKGREYFEGNINDMIIIFINITYEHKYLYEETKLISNMEIEINNNINIINTLTIQNEKLNNQISFNRNFINKENFNNSNLIQKLKYDNSILNDNNYKLRLSINGKDEKINKYYNDNKKLQDILEKKNNIIVELNNSSKNIYQLKKYINKKEEEINILRNSISKYINTINQNNIIINNNYLFKICNNKYFKYGFITQMCYNIYIIYNLIY